MYRQLSSAEKADPNRASRHTPAGLDQTKPSRKPDEGRSALTHCPLKPNRLNLSMKTKRLSRCRAKVRRSRITFHASRFTFHASRFNPPSAQIQPQSSLQSNQKIRPVKLGQTWSNQKSFCQPRPSDWSMAIQLATIQSSNHPSSIIHHPRSPLPQ